MFGQAGKTQRGNIGMKTAGNTPKTKELFETMPVSSALMKMAMPAIASQLVTLIYNVADTWFIARTDNPYMVAASSLVLPAVFMPIFPLCVFPVCPNNIALILFSLYLSCLAAFCMELSCPRSFCCPFLKVSAHLKATHPQDTS